MAKTISPIVNLEEKTSTRTLFENSQYQWKTIHPNDKHSDLINKNPSLVSVDHHLIPTNNSDDTLDKIKKTLNSSNTLNYTTTSNSHHRNITTNERPCSLTEMLLVYAQKDANTSTNLTQTRSDNNSLTNILNVLELHFNTYADDKRQIYFEGIFQILHDFKEEITELALIETMQLLQVLTLITFFLNRMIIFLLRSIPLLHVPLKILFLFYVIYLL
jgi:hypothetical protein